MTLPLQPPIAKRVLHVHPYEHGDPTRSDDYNWLKDQSKGSKRTDILEYLAQENEYFKQQVIEPNAALIDTLYSEFISKIEESDQDVPYFRAPFWYYKKTLAGEQYPIHCRKRESMDAEEEQLLNMNLVKDSKFLDVQATLISPDHKLLAYVLDKDGYEHCSIYFKNLETGEDLTDVIPMASSEIVWSPDNKSLYYVEIDATNNRPYKLRCHILGDDSATDVTLFHNTDEKFETKIEKSSSERFLIMTVASMSTSECHYLDLEATDAELRCFCPRETRHQYTIAHQGHYFYILTNGGGQFLNRKLQRVGVENTAKELWEDLLPYDPYTELAQFAVFRDFIVLEQRDSKGLLGLRCLVTSGDVLDSFMIQFDEEIFTAWLPYGGQKIAYAGDCVWFNYTSSLVPRKNIEFNVKTKESKVLKQVQVPGGFDASPYTVRRVYVPIPEETRITAPFDTPVADKIPMTLVYRTDLLKADGTNKALLSGYGCYGYPADVYFNSNLFSLIDRGIIFATAHVRGGGDLGQAWYETGKLSHKKNTFTDLIACARHLVQSLQLTRHELLAMTGASAGGLLMGAAMNLQPDVAACVVAGVGWLDPLNSSMDASIPLTTVEWEEIGNPNEKEAFDYLFSYSPYENIRSGVKYPNIMLTSGINDPRVPYWEVAKYCAKMRASETDGGEGDPDRSLLVLDCKMGAGHGGSSGRYAKYKEKATEYAFILSQLESAEARFVKK
ncbi:protease II [Chytriomyces sp. MP71]|nr:protease II [Chytriomyces sp. MP71]